MRLRLRYPEERMEMNRRRWEAFEQFAYLDRVPVRIGVGARYFVEPGVGFRDYYKGPEVQVQEQLKFYQWRLEQVDDDSVTSTTVIVNTDFVNLFPAANFDGVTVHLAGPAPPRVIPSLHSVDDVHRLLVPKPTDNLAGVAVEWYHRVKEIVRDYQVTFNGEPVSLRIGMSQGHGPVTAAIQMAGEENLFLWMYDAPAAVHELLEKCTEAQVNWLRYTDELLDYPRDHSGSVADGMEMLSPELFKEFAMPYLNRMYKEFPGKRLLHMCGDMTHLLPVLVQDLKITHFDGFGYPLDPKVAARQMGGKVRMVGNIDPMLIWRGPREEIRKACLYALEHLAPCGGFALADGANIAPGTPIQHINVLAETAREYGLPSPASGGPRPR